MDRSLVYELKKGIREEMGTMNKLSDDFLEDVNGGFQETNPALATSGLEIACPNCHSTNKADFSKSALMDNKTKSVEYHCKCGASFVCYDGYTIPKSNWISLCKKKDYSYPFA
ncbi:MAG: hypothetical protein J6P05_01385 [Lachnospiraceae bacterium]|nr:hypothetical protein [Lachnospiraceae bacterium]